MVKVFCFGEILLHFSPSGDPAFIGEQNMPFYLGGAELNVSSALANWGMPVAYGTAMPANFLSNTIASYLASKNIDTSAIQYSGDRIGVFYLAQGKDMKNAAVVFDRKDSSFSCLQKGAIDWTKQLKDIGWFHITAISASLSQSATDLCVEALEAATAMGIPISIDLNYRPKLWQYGKTPLQVMPTLVKHATYIMGNLWSVEVMLGVKSAVANSMGCTKEALNEAAMESMRQLIALYPKAKCVAYTFRLEKEYYGLMHQDNQVYISKIHPAENVINTVGSGDCFMAGLIYGTEQKYKPAELINFAAAAGIGKQYELGDATTQTVAQIKNRMA